MNLEYVISTEHRCAFVRMIGEATDFDFSESVVEVFSDPKWDPTYDSIWDGTTLTKLIMSPEHMDAMIARMKSLTETGHTGRLVGVMTGRDHMMIAQLFSIHANREARQSAAFETHEEALEWLGLPADAWPESLD